MKYVIGNLKSHKNIIEAQQWLDTFLAHDVRSLEHEVSIIICPPFPFLQMFKLATANLPHVSIGAQDVSHFGAGSYTGEVSAFSLHGLVSHVLIGHSERRTYFHETNETVSSKVDESISMDIIPIVLVRNAGDTIPSRVEFIAYEPVDAIGSGHTMATEEIIEMKKTLGIDQSVRFIYGGSVTSTNVRDIVSQHEIDGVLVGSSSLDPDEFYTLIERASHIPSSS